MPAVTSSIGWGDARTIGELAGALALLAGFVINERRHRGGLSGPGLRAGGQPQLRAGSFTTSSPSGAQPSGG